MILTANLWVRSLKSLAFMYHLTGQPAKVPTNFNPQSEIRNPQSANPQSANPQSANPQLGAVTIGLLTLGGLLISQLESVPAFAPTDPARAATTQAVADATPTQETPPSAALPQRDASGNPIRRAPTGHVSNYDESKVGTYTLPDPLLLQDGEPVRDADTWFKRRRPEILSLYETHIYGRVPERVPKAAFQVVETDSKFMDGAAVRKHLVMRFGDSPDGPTS